MRKWLAGFIVLLFAGGLAASGFAADYPKEVLDWAKEVKQKVGGQRGNHYLLPFEKGGWEGFLGTPFRLLNQYRFP